MRILIVEDNAGYAAALEMAVSSIEGYEVTGRAASGLEAVKCAQIDSFDLVLLDLRLPEGTGLEVLPELKKSLPVAKVIVLTQSEKEHDVVQALGRGADGYLLKSAKVTQIVSGIQSVLAGERQLILKSPAISSVDLELKTPPQKTWAPLPIAKLKYFACWQMGRQKKRSPLPYA